ncbi:MAG: dihydrofolate reductase [Nitrospirae bacterium]|nr:dihydrofolate reductase [Nitrospirota bacterium]
MKVALIAAVSADGYIAQTPGQRSMDWTSREDAAFFIEKTREFGVVVMGRKTFETIGRPLAGRLTVVMTSRPDHGRNIHGLLEYTSDAPGAIVENLASRGFGGIALAGGAKIYGEFLRAGLVDEVYLTVEPVLFGEGVRLADGIGRMDMALIETRMLGASTVLLHYRL